MNELLTRSNAATAVGSQWYALQTRANHEKKVAERLSAHDIESMLPLFTEVHRWKDRNKKVDAPLFPGYVFVKLALANRMRAITVGGVVRIVSFGQVPAPMSAGDIEIINSCVQNSSLLRPHAFLTDGTKVRVFCGPLAGLTGILLRKKGSSRLVLSVGLIQSSVVVEVSDDDVAPADPISSSLSSLPTANVVSHARSIADAPEVLPLSPLPS
jgi:transcription antitermination factor NusG